MLADELLELIKSRRSIRNFTDEPISDEDLLRIIDAARYAPSNTNRQPWKFIIIKNDSVKNKIAETVAQKMDSLRSSIKDAETSDLLNSYEEYFLFIR
jgi:nitroreductase